jgi:hypothetical protein
VSADRSRFGRAHFSLTEYPGTTIYMTVIATLGAVGDTRSPLPLVTAVVLTLPSGLVGLIGVYASYAILLGVTRVFGARVMTGNGWGPLWFVILDELVVVLIFAAVALANARLVGQIADGFRVRHRRQS